MQSCRGLRTSATLKLAVGFPKLVQRHLLLTAALKKKGAASTHGTLAIGTDCLIHQGAMAVLLCQREGERVVSFHLLWPQTYTDKSHFDDNGDEVRELISSDSE